MSRWGKPTKNKRRTDPRYFLNETALSENKEYWDDLFGNKWGDQHTWKMVTANSLVGVYNNMGFTDPQRFIDGLPYEWQKPKATQALQDAGIDVSGVGAASEPAAAKPGSIGVSAKYIPSDEERASGQGRHLKK